MNYQIQAESGVQLLARINKSKNPSAAGLDSKLFLTGPKSKELIEIKGAPSTGKTLLLTQFIMRSILPAEYKNVAIGGLNVGVIFIETDSHFDLLKLVTLMERTISGKMRKKNVIVGEEVMQEIIKSALKNLILLSCYSGPELFVTFHLVKTLLLMHPNISLILVDSIAAFYQEDIKTQGFKKFDTYCRKSIEVLQQCAKANHTPIIYTKPTLYHSKNSVQEEFSCEPAVGKINIRIELKFHESERQTFVAVVQNSSTTSQIKYTIGNDGIRWLDDIV